MNRAVKANGGFNKVKKNEFLQIAPNYESCMKGWRIETEKLDMSDFVLGCYYNKDESKWIVYINKGYGRHCVRLITASEEEAFDELCSIMDFRYSYV